MNRASSIADTRQYDAASPGCGKTHLAIALGAEVVKAGRGVYFCTLAELITSLALKVRCGDCGSESSKPGAMFCSDCGAKL